MQLKEISIQNFRCFSNFNLQFNKKVILIEGKNGTGKTSILEAIYYICYLKSFRTRITSDLVNALTEKNFFIKAKLELDFIENEIQAGFSADKRSVKINQKVVQSYKEIIDLLRIVALTEDDINLIKGSPEKRRSFLDQFILLHNPEFVSVLKKYKRALENRNALFAHGNVDLESYDLWTQQIWDLSQKIRKERQTVLKRIGQNVANLTDSAFGNKYIVKFKYLEKNGSVHKDYEEFKNENFTLINQEISQCKNLIGAHLDDFLIYINSKQAKIFASRGQQKLLTVLLKMAQVQDITNMYPDKNIIFLLDDFVTDFDNEKIDILINILLNLNAQLIFTCPIEDSFLKSILSKSDADIIKL